MLALKFSLLKVNGYRRQTHTVCLDTVSIHRCKYSVTMTGQEMTEYSTHFMILPKQVGHLYSLKKYNQHYEEETPENSSGIESSQFE